MSNPINYFCHIDLELKHQELSSWKEEWETQVYQIHGSKMSEHIDGVTPMKGILFPTLIMYFEYHYSLMVCKFT
jgi:hypothetical protein